MGFRGRCNVQLVCGAAALMMAACKEPRVEHGRTDSPPRNKNTPKLRHVAHIPMKSAREITFYADRAYVAQNFAGMTSIDISDPEKPVVAKAFPPEFVQPLHVVNTGNARLSLADRFRGLVLLDISKPDEPTSLSQLALPGVATHHALYQLNGHWYAAVACGGSGLSIVDITTVSSPTLVGRYTFDVDYTRRVAYLDQTVFLADNFDGGMKLVDVSQPDNPRFLLKVGIRGFYDSVSIANRMLYVGCRHYGTRLFQYPERGEVAEDPTSPSLDMICSIFRSKDRVRDVVPFNEERMVVANDEGGVDLYDTSNHAQPVLLDEWRFGPEGGSAMSAGVYHGYIYVPSWDGGVHVLKLEELI